jgi:hypothetical protein
MTQTRSNVRSEYKAKRKAQQKEKAVRVGRMAVSIPIIHESKTPMISPKQTQERPSRIEPSNGLILSDSILQNTS